MKIRDNSKLRSEVLKHALINAISHKGKALAKPVLGKVLSEKPEYKTRIQEVKSAVEEIVEEVNKLSLDSQKKMLKELGIEEVEKPKVEERKGLLPPLPNVDKYEKIVTRFSPNPDCVLHLGSARAIILCYEYAKMYGGLFYLRFEDTDPRLKKSALQFYDSIREDLLWLGCPWDAEFIQSDRIPIYYEYAEKLIKKGDAYVCTCKPEDFRRLVGSKRPCPCRDISAEESFSRWLGMLNGEYGEGEAVVRIKTDLEHPNPAVRDWPALRIIDTKKYPHPRVGDKYRVWPLYNFACGIDDHLLGVTHIIRGKEHLTNQARQMYLYRHLGWEYPEAIHYGRLKIVDAVLSKSKIVKGIREGLYRDWSDPRLATLVALRRRGITPEAIRQMILNIGPKTVDITLSWENLYAYNRKILDPRANRYFFIDNPKRLRVYGVPDRFEAKIPLHPDDPDRGYRRFEVNPKDRIVELWVSGRDMAGFKEGLEVRLKGLFNIKIEELSSDKVEAQYTTKEYEYAKERKLQLIHWLLHNTSVATTVIMPDASEIKGLSEELCAELKPDDIVQFERFGFVRIDRVEKDSLICYYAHR